MPVFGANRSGVWKQKMESPTKRTRSQERASKQHPNFVQPEQPYNISVCNQLATSSGIRCESELPNLHGQIHNNRGREQVQGSRELLMGHWQVHGLGSESWLFCFVELFRVVSPDVRVNSL